MSRACSPWKRVAAPSIRFVPWAALASCWPLPQQLLPVSATGGGRRRCTLRINSGIRFFIRDSEKPAGFSESPFHGRGRGGKRYLQFRPHFNHCSPSVKIAFGALRRARQTRNKNNHSAEYVQSAAEHILNRPALRQGTVQNKKSRKPRLPGIFWR